MPELLSIQAVNSYAHKLSFQSPQFYFPTLILLLAQLSLSVTIPFDLILSYLHGQLIIVISHHFPAILIVHFSFNCMYLLRPRRSVCRFFDYSISLQPCLLVFFHAFYFSASCPFFFILFVEMRLKRAFYFTP